VEEKTPVARPLGLILLPKLTEYPPSEKARRSRSNQIQRVRSLIREVQDDFVERWLNNRYVTVGCWGYSFRIMKAGNIDGDGDQATEPEELEENEGRMF
jgi:hypothetical protein